MRRLLRAFFHWQYSQFFIGGLFAAGVAMLTYNHFVVAYMFFGGAGIWALIYWQVSDYLTTKLQDFSKKASRAKAKLHQFKAVEALSKARRAYVVANAGGSAVILVLTVVCCLWTRSVELEYELSLPEGWLTPSNEPSLDHSACRLSPADAVFIYFGRAVISYAPAGFTNHTVIQVGGNVLLSLNRGPRGIAMSTRIFDSDGILVEIEKGHFKVYRGDFIKREHPDSHTLAVYDKWNNERLRVRYLNPRAIWITGNFFFPGHPTIIVKDDEMRIGTNSFSGSSCIGGSSQADILVN